MSAFPSQTFLHICSFSCLTVRLPLQVCKYPGKCVLQVGVRVMEHSVPLCSTAGGKHQPRRLGFHLLVGHHCLQPCAMTGLLIKTSMLCFLKANRGDVHPWFWVIETQASPRGDLEGVGDSRISSRLDVRRKHNKGVGLWLSQLGWCTVRGR